jgi:hypothetical protein
MMDKVVVALAKREGVDDDDNDTSPRCNKGQEHTTINWKEDSMMMTTTTVMQWWGR